MFEQRQSSTPELVERRDREEPELSRKVLVSFAVPKISETKKRASAARGICELLNRVTRCRRVSGGAAEACYTVDLLAGLRAELAETAAVIDSAQGPHVHPLLVEVRQQRRALAKLIASLGLPKDVAVRRAQAGQQNPAVPPDGTVR